MVQVVVEAEEAILWREIRAMCKRTASSWVSVSEACKRLHEAGLFVVDSAGFSPAVPVMHKACAHGLLRPMQHGKTWYLSPVDKIDHALWTISAGVSDADEVTG